MTAHDDPPHAARPGGPVLVMTKVRPPVIRRATLTRVDLQTRVERCADRRLVLVACPAGFGKTTLLASWAAARPAAEPVGWVTVDEGDNDPMVLWAHIIEALSGIRPAVGDAVTVEAAGSAALTDAVLPRLVNALTDQPSMTLVLDDYHRLTGRASRDSVAWFLEHAPAGFQLVIATRSEPRLPLAVLRARGELCEFRSDDLRFTVQEAEVLLNGRLGLGLDPADVGSLVNRTEGWPAGLYLAGLSLEGTADRHGFVQRFGASNRHVVDLLVDEVLDTHDPDMQELMTRTSILERISGPLCDAVTQLPGAGDRLAELARSNLFLVPLDDRGEWYRFHHLFGQLLRVQLERREPGFVPTLHRRASAWHRDHGGTPEAVTHAINAGDYDQATELIAGVWLEFTNACRYETVRGWLNLFPDDVLRSSARLLLVNAWVSSMSADRVDATRCIDLIEGLGTIQEGPLPEGFRSVESSLTLLKAVAAWGDVGAQIENGRRAAVLEPPGTPWHPVACWAIGVGSYLRVDFDEADRWVDTAARTAPEAGQWLTAASALAYQSLVAGELHRPQQQQELAERAVDMTERLGLGGVVGEADVALGVSLAARGCQSDALPLLERGVDAVRSWGQPTELASALLHLASVLRSLGDPPRAAGIAKEARSIIDACRDPGNLGARLEVFEHARQPRAAHPGDELTERELEILRLLDGPRAESDLAAQLFVSFNTLHTHVRSIYRKLGVSSRADAVTRARSRGLLELDLT